MPTFDTPRPITVTLEIGVGAVHIAAGDRTDTVVEVRPTDPGRPSDVSAAQRTRVDASSNREGIHRVDAATRLSAVWRAGR